MRPFLASLLYFGIAMACLYPAVVKGVDSVYTAHEMELTHGTWMQYGTQVLTMRGCWSEAANEAVTNSWPDVGAMKGVLDD